MGWLARAACLLLFAAVAFAGAQVPLHDGWQVGSSCTTPVAGEQVSTPSFKADGWYTASVPSTVLAVQLANHAFQKELPGDEDIFAGMNLRKLPGMTYPIGTFYSNQDVPADSPYHCGWWYRRPFAAKTAKAQRTWLHFGGINYRANVWVNGKRVADTTQVAGAYRTYDFDVTDVLEPNGNNVVAVETFAPNANDLGINWVDWNPCPPDKDMGLWGAVSLHTTGVVTVRSPMVTTHFASAALDSADLDLTVELENASFNPVTGILRSELSGLPQSLSLDQPVTLAAHERRSLTLTQAQFAQLRIQNPPIWWPVDWGSHPLETLCMSFRLAGALSDEKSVRFGIREMASELDANNHLLFRVNRRPILIRGGGWSPDMLLRVSSERLRTEIAMVEDLHLNTIRLEGKLETEEFFDLADENGILVMAGWCCCDHWEHWTKWTDQDEQIALASLRAQMLRMRHHASLLVWLNGSDGPPPERIERGYLAVERETAWPNAILSSAAATPTIPTGPSGVKMLGPYDYVVPSYWLRDQQKAGGAYGFNTETSPGPAIPSVAELKRFLPQDHLWPQDATWDFHTGGGKYKSLAVINRAMEHIYGQPADLADYTRTTEAMAYDSERAMFEAYARDKYQSTGVVQWMLNNAWPSLIWHLYDYYLQPGAGYYGTKKACEPLHVQFSYDDHSVMVVNSTQKMSGPLTVHVQSLDLQMKRTFDETVSVTTGADATTRAIVIPQNAMGTSAVTFVDLELRGASGVLISRNFYWIPTKQTLFDWPNTDYTHTPPATFEDLTSLKNMAPAAVKLEIVSATQNKYRLRLTNTSHILAFQLSLEVLTKEGKPSGPVLWDDNFLNLLPGEARDVSGTSLASTTLRDKPFIHLVGWNVPEMREELTPHVDLSDSRSKRVTEQALRFAR